MQNDSGNERFFVVEGARLERLEILGPIHDVLHHPLYPNTPRAYINQGRLWECRCDCGTHVLISEYQLTRRKNKSCGCLKREGKNKTDEERQKGLELKLARLEINTRIKRLRYELASEKMKYNKDEKKIDAIAADLRSAYAKKASIAAQYTSTGERKRKISNSWKVQHLHDVGVIDDDKLEEFVKKQEEKYKLANK